LEKVEIRHARPADIAAVRAMMREYIEWIALDLAFQEINAELDGLPGDYAPPRGVLLVAADGDRYAGVIALRPIDTRICEMKRLFIRPEARGLGLARRLIDALLAEARRLGYAEIRLDTLPMMGAAQALYEAMGFVDMPAYYDTPIAGTRFMRKAL
jgi:ribosomal protein S18 acetylase RimI-like enzyme